MLTKKVDFPFSNKMFGTQVPRPFSLDHIKKMAKLQSEIPLKTRTIRVQNSIG